MNIRTERFFNRGGARLLSRVTLFFLLCTFSGPGFARISKSKFNLLMTQVELLQAEVESNQEKLEAQTKEIERLSATLKELEAGVEGRDTEIAKIRKVLIASKKRLIHLYKTRKTLTARLVKLEEQSSDRGALNDHVTVFADLRTRGEYSNNAIDFNSDSNDSATRYHQRTRLGLQLRATERVTATIVMQDARFFGSETSPNGDDAGLGLWKAFFTLKPPGITGLSVDVGRMSLSYGSGLLIGESDWSYNGQAFDGLRLRYRHKKLFKADLFYTLVKERLTPMGSDIHLAGLVLSTEQWQKYITPELYVFFLDDSAVAPQGRKFYTIGMRASGAPVKGLNYDFEAAIQIGTVGEAEKVLDRFATAYHGHISYTVQHKLKPSLHALFYAASGDGNPDDDRNVNFDPLFPDVYRHLDPMQLFRMSNLTFFGGKATIQPHKSMGVELGFYMANLSSKRGGIAGFPGQQYPVNELEADIGKEIHAAFTYQRAGILELRLGLATFLAGGAVDGVVGSSDRVDWAYGQARVIF